MKGNRTLLLHSRTATAVWADYWRKKLRCRALMGRLHEQ